MPRYLGQHFLNNPDIVAQIIKSSHTEKTETILEIGPGEGVLTEELCGAAKQVIAIELDTKLRDALEERFKDQKNIDLIFEDILKINLPELLTERKVSHYKIIANIPYYITSKIIRLFLETTHQPDELILMIQKEVAQRIVAPKGKMSILSVSVQYYAEVEILFDVAKDNFNPPPKVDSSVIKIYNIKKSNLAQDKKFFKIVRAGFCARRKTLINNLSNSFHIDKKDVEKILLQINLTSNVRAQELSIDDWGKLSDLLK